MWLRKYLMASRTIRNLQSYCVTRKNVQQWATNLTDLATDKKQILTKLHFDVCHVQNIKPALPVQKGGGGKNVFKSDDDIWDILKIAQSSKGSGYQYVLRETKVWQRELRSYTSHITIIYDRWESPHKTGLGFTFTGRLIYGAFHTPQR